MSTYVYAITLADHPVDVANLPGVGDPPSLPRTLGTPRLTAVVSDAPEDLRAKRRDLLAHQHVLERLMADGAVLPMRFGLVSPDDQQVRAALEEHRDAYTERLGELTGCLEYNLKAARDEDDRLREIVADSAEIRRLNDLTRRDPNAHDQRVTLGELVSNEVRARRDREAEDLLARLAPEVAEHAVGDPGEAHFLNVSFLVSREQAASLTRRVDEEATRRGAAYTLNLNGPLPPYSFV
ncbi:GvpL/GvpF family gas vesicle protein [Streptomyces oceani]|uniref:Gas vesicle protein n=1 Tax=Streptomyces oceani TaxID=1075402 RepID=A0A1E7KPF1_9ACTN|nr:GvpL/GvpF family gas vesicle protein [Streptomyces oceani]OEV05774.1 gas vesicle protein [Streptomyces oceani]